MFRFFDKLLLKFLESLMVFSKIYKWTANIFRLFTRKINKIMDKQKFKKEIDILEQELSSAYCWFYAFRGIQEHLNLNTKTYEQYSNFFYTVYLSFYNELIHNVSRLHDTSKDALSLLKILRKLKEHEIITEQERKLFDQIEGSEIKNKIMIIRDKLGRAHLDGKCSINSEKQNNLYEKCMIEPIELLNYLRLLLEALRTIALRLDQHTVLLEPYSTISSEIKEIFQKLSKV